tara:strand:- start:20931 stop:22733 length:1803 start_codon:yes stop_codon:yes gene_type:complete
MANKPQINYLARDFESIKASLVQYAKRFYSNEYNDFTEASFGSFLLDAVAYIGDVTSFQLDYQSNENMLMSAINRDNILKMARQLGYKEPLSPSVSGFVDIYLDVPTVIGNSGPDNDYLPILKKGTSFSSTEGSVFILAEDVDFSLSDTEFVVSTVNSSTGIPTKYAAKRSAPVVSGMVETKSFAVADRTNLDTFYELEVDQPNLIEIISVVDLEGNIYYEVDSLSQNVVYRGYINENSTASNTLKILKPIVAPRRFTTDVRDDGTFLVFGNGKEDVGSALNSVENPTQVILQQYGKDYISSGILDPTVLNGNDKFGIGPSNTVLTITYRYNTTATLSAGANSLNQVENASFSFSVDATSESSKNEVIVSLEVENPERIAGDRATLTDEELRQAAMGVYASQNRIVTLQDYQSFTYRMPAEFGTIKKAVALRDDMSPRRSINLYVTSADSLNNFVPTSQAQKDNLKTWLSRYKTISDSVDILDGKVVNFGMRFSFITNPNFNLMDARIAAEDRARFYFERRKYNFGESINVAALTKLINDTEQVDDVLSVQFYNVYGGVYSDIEYEIKPNTTADGRFVIIPANYVFEIKFLGTNITGEAI